MTDISGRDVMLDQVWCPICERYWPAGHPMEITPAVEKYMSQSRNRFFAWIRKLLR